ncbi:thiosulfate oxidation carrier protein SoxY [Paramagnetospirillum kuznetsovii]|uniref:Thiosulfate oxidation carrier protein SoxY n=1 Tax=Paramagnetospirillum kuznetsovii TaxID=2053833 RepID=A0A364NUV0_9PROT|nr:thiosulfate oxidation carrier protein SoxY [Paramagnetospirillum kuznetsovii]RAU20858.1 thiosulfate oxidation carrier protein SoxY [Paramagnetospirillum kuznetsovii]
MSQDVNSDLSRRGVLLGMGAGAAALALMPSVAHATREEANDAFAKLTGGAKPQAGKVTLKLPEIAENGNTVPFTVVVDNPMTEANYVKAIHVMAEGNPAPGVVSYFLQPTGKAEVYGRMRLAKTQDVRAVAVLSDGSAWEGKKEVKVTIGGCGG